MSNINVLFIYVNDPITKLRFFMKEGMVLLLIGNSEQFAHV